MTGPVCRSEPLDLPPSSLFLPGAAEAEVGRVIGDSIGVGVSWAAKGSGVVSTAKNSVAIYSGQIMEQLRQAKRGETVFVSLGTNDAVGGALDVKSKVAQILAEADRLGVKLVWIGPPCVRKPWEQYSKKLDEILAAATRRNVGQIRQHAGAGVLQRSAARGGGGAFYYGGLYPHVAEGRRGRRVLDGRRLGRARPSRGVGAEPPVHAPSSPSLAPTTRQTARALDRDAGAHRGCAAMIRFPRVQRRNGDALRRRGGVRFCEFPSQPRRRRDPGHGAGQVACRLRRRFDGGRAVGRDVPPPWKRQMSGGEDQTASQGQKRIGADPA